MASVADHAGRQEHRAAFVNQKVTDPSGPPLMAEGGDGGDRDLPPHLVRTLGRPRAFSGDPTGRRIARLLRLHPELDREYHDVDLRKLSAVNRKSLLARIETQLGIV